MQDDYIRFRCSSVQKSLIVNRASDLGLSVTDYILQCCQYERYHSDEDEGLIYIPVSRKFFSEFFSER